MSLPRIILCPVRRGGYMQRIVDAAAELRIGQPIVYRNLTVFPLLGRSRTAADYLTLDEALARKCAQITEVSEGGSVPELKFVNSGDRRVFLLDGEELVGAKQNRVLNLSILVPAGKTLVVPVSCVEAGRWHSRTRQFSSAPRTYYAQGRARKMAQVSQSMRSAGRRTSDQGEVWRDISDKFAKFGASSETSAVSDIYEQQSARLEDYVSSFSVSEGQAGAVFAIDGRVVGLELFDSTETLRKLFPKLLRSYGLDALERAGSTPPSQDTECTPAEAEAFLSKVTQAKVEEFPAVGEGEDIRLAGPALTGAALAADDRIVHLSAFAVE
jgi:hypothetical protein